MEAVAAELEEQAVARPVQVPERAAQQEQVPERAVRPERAQDVLRDNAPKRCKVFESVRAERAGKPLSSKYQATWRRSADRLPPRHRRFDHEIFRGSLARSTSRGAPRCATSQSCGLGRPNEAQRSDPHHQHPARSASRARQHARNPPADARRRSGKRPHRHVGEAP